MDKLEKIEHLLIAQNEKLDAIIEMLKTITGIQNVKIPKTSAKTRKEQQLEEKRRIALELSKTLGPGFLQFIDLS